MKSIICIISSIYGVSFIYVILVYISSAFSSPSCGLYGAPPCQYLPAPPGQTPSCARPGKTYCEHVDNYPTYLIKHLVHKWGYEAKQLLIDETWEDFAAVAWHETPVFYDPAFIFPQQPHYGTNNNGHEFNGYKYGTPSTGSGSGSGGGKYAADTYYYSKQRTTESPTFLLYSSAAQRLNLNKNQVNPFNGGLKVTPNNPTLWLKRIARDLSQKRSDVSYSSTPVANFTAKLSRDVSLHMNLLDIMGVEQDPTKSRIRRQTAGRSSLCQTTSQFIAPQAALNNKGNWMFVVNEANTARQMVKAELCASNTCSNLCQLPNGYNSRCEQKFVQKRLIALQANGQSLYTDTFWFPSCCVCTIAAI